MEADNIRMVMFYTRSSDQRNHQMVVRMRSGTVHRFSAGKMKEEFSKSSLSEPTLHQVGVIAFNRAMTFVPEDDEDLIPDTADPEVELVLEAMFFDEAVVSEQVQRDLDIVQDLLSEFQDGLAELSA